jgi:hypothetical protein
MADLFAGCVLARLPSARALASARFIEFAPRSPLPTYGTLARIRKQASGWPALSLVAPRDTWSTPRGALRSGPELDAGVEWLTRVSDILSAFAIVLATGAELTTGERDRELLANFCERLRPTGRTLVLAPRGLWEPEHAIPFAAQLGAVYGFDALEHDAPAGTVAYARVRPMGARPRLTEGHLAQIAERLANSGAERAYVSLESEQCVREVKRLTRLYAEVGEIVDDEEDEFEDDEQDEQGPEDDDELDDADELDDDELDGDQDERDE